MYWKRNHIPLLIQKITTSVNTTTEMYCLLINKFAQSNLGRGPRHGTVVHVCRKVPIGYDGVPQIRPQKYPFPWTDPQTPPPASSMDLSNLWCQTASGSDPPFSTMHWTDRPTHRPTNRPWESLITIGRWAPKATRPKKWLSERFLNGISAHKRLLSATQMVQQDQ